MLCTLACQGLREGFARPLQSIQEHLHQLQHYARTCLAGDLCSCLQAADMPVVWFQMVELPESKRSVLQQSPHLDMSIVATELHCTSLKLQLENKQMIQVSLKSASPLQSLDELRKLTGCGGSENDPFIFSAGSAGTGGQFQDAAVGFATTFKPLWMSILME